MTALGFVALWVPRLWCLAIIGFCCLVAKWVLAQRRQRRADVRTARALARGMWLEDTEPADWQAVQDAVNRVHEANDDTLAEHFAAWDAQLTGDAA